MMPRDSRQRGPGLPPYGISLAGPVDTSGSQQAVTRLLNAYRFGDFSQSMTFQYDMFSPPHYLRGRALRASVEKYYPALRLCRHPRYGPTYASGPEQLTVAAVLSSQGHRAAEATFVVQHLGPFYHPYFIFGYQDGRGDVDPDEDQRRFEPGPRGPRIPGGPMRPYGWMPRVYPPPSPVAPMARQLGLRYPTWSLIGGHFGRTRPSPEASPDTRAWSAKQ